MVESLVGRAGPRRGGKRLAGTGRYCCRIRCSCRWWTCGEVCGVAVCAGCCAPGEDTAAREGPQRARLQQGRGPRPWPLHVSDCHSKTVHKISPCTRCQGVLLTVQTSRRTQFTFPLRAPLPHVQLLVNALLQQHAHAAAQMNGFLPTMKPLHRTACASSQLNETKQRYSTGARKGGRGPNNRPEGEGRSRPTGAFDCDGRGDGTATVDADGRGDGPPGDMLDSLDGRCEPLSAGTAIRSLGSAGCAAALPALAAAAALAADLGEPDIWRTSASTACTGLARSSRIVMLARRSAWRCASGSTSRSSSESAPGRLPPKLTRLGRRASARAVSNTPTACVSSPTRSDESRAKPTLTRRPLRAVTADLLLMQLFPLFSLGLRLWTPETCEAKARLG
jgi:hypothetical protein